MELTKNITTGPYRDFLGTLTRSLGQYEHYYRHVKVGITGNPDRRADEHGRDGWQRMVVKYKTGSVRNANIIEKLFIGQRQDLTNEWPGFSNMPNPGPYFVYLLLK